ncbi:MAG: hypothetical protein AAFY71_01215 [Bacteroidota bacterium]
MRSLTVLMAVIATSIGFSQPSLSLIKSAYQKGNIQLAKQAIDHYFLDRSDFLGSDAWMLKGDIYRDLVLSSIRTQQSFPSKLLEETYLAYEKAESIQHVISNGFRMRSEVIYDSSHVRQFTEALQLLGNTFLRKGETESARVVFTQMFKHAKLTAEESLAFCKQLSEKGHHALAKNLAKQARDTHPKDPSLIQFAMELVQHQHK